MARILVIDYSRSGNTHKVAQAIAGACHADLEQIRDVKPRHGLWGWIRSAKEAMRAIPAEIRPSTRDPSNYDLVVLGSPVWVSHVSSPMRAYIGQFSGSLASIALFVTEGGNGGPNALAEMSRLAGLKPVATLELPAKELGRDLGPRIATFAARIEEALERASIAKSRP